MTIEFRVREEVITHLRNYINSPGSSNEPFCNFRKKRLTIQQVLKEIEERTELGQELYNTWEMLYDISY